MYQLSLTAFMKRNNIQQEEGNQLNRKLDMFDIIFTLKLTVDAVKLHLWKIASVIYFVVSL